MKSHRSRPFRLISWLILILLLIFMLFLIVMTMKDYSPIEKESLAVSGKTGRAPSDTSVFTIMSWNIGYFGLGEKMDFFYDGGKLVRPSIAEFEEYYRGGMDYLADQDEVDFILLQEVDRNSKRSYRTDEYQEMVKRMPGFSSVFAMNYDVLFVPVPLKSPMGTVKSGIAEFSRFDPEEAYRISLPGQYAWPMKLFMLDRCFILTRYKLDSGRDLVIINTHNEAFDKGNMRQAQMEYLREVMFKEYQNGNYVVAGGDWNMNPAGFTKSDYSNMDISMTIDPPIDPAFFPSGWNWEFDPSLPTNRSVIDPYSRGKTPTTIIDFFIISPNVLAEEVKTKDLGFRWSDHQPVLMKFKCISLD